jgi:hypothetical protein
MELSRYKIGTLWIGGYKKSAADKLIPGLSSIVGIASDSGESLPTLLVRLGRFILRPEGRKPIQ